MKFFKLKIFGAIPLIIEHLKSNDDEVRSAACWAVNCSAIESYIAVDYCKHGFVYELFDFLLNLFQLIMLYIYISEQSKY
jgi:hypothetical protein